MVYCYETFSHKEFKYRYFAKLNYSFFLWFWSKSFTTLEKPFKIIGRMLKKQKAFYILKCLVNNFCEFEKDQEFFFQNAWCKQH